MDNNTDALRVLVLDGGDLRVVSEMIILAEIMSRVAWGRKEETTLPCKYFHVIAGVGAGGLLSILLGVLELTADDARDEFICIYKSILENGQLTPQDRSEILESSLKDLLERRNSFPEKQKLLGTGTCRTFVCSVARKNMSICRKFRNYKCREIASDITVINAVRATWASPGLFASLFDGPPMFQEEFLGGDCAFSNPTREAIKEIHEYFGPTRRVGSIISLGCGLPSEFRSQISEIFFSNSERAAIELQSQLEETEVYHRYGIPANQDPIYSFRTTDVPGIVGDTMTYLGIHSRELNCCILDGVDRVTTNDIYRSGRTPVDTTAGTVPPLSPYFVLRIDVAEALDNALVKLGDAACNNTMVVLGMGGSGKTQSILNFIKVHKDKFPVVFFIDASSAETIESDLIRKVRSFTRNRSVKTISDAFSALCQPGEMSARPWVIVYDGADDPNLDVAALIPSYDHGMIIITSRNQQLKLLSPLACVEIDAMSVQDAVALLLKAAMPSARNHSIRDREHAHTIVESLGCLAIAIGQAGCHIQMQGGLNRYADRLTNNRKTVLRRSMGPQLKGHQSVYAALDVTLPALTPRAVDMLSTMCFLHPAEIPLEVVFRAARGQFGIQPGRLLPAPSDLQTSAQDLCNVFIPNFVWNEEEVWDLLDELQRYSLVTLIPSESSTSLRFHKLVFAWAQDRLSEKQCTNYQALAVRLLACCTTEEDEDLFDSLLPHVKVLGPPWAVVHVNDRVGLSNIIRHGGQANDLEMMWTGIYEAVSRFYGMDHLNTSEAALYLADACWRNDADERANALEQEAVKFRVQSLGRNCRETMNAIGRQAQGFYNQGELEKAEPLQREVLYFRQRDHTGEAKYTAQAMEDLADTLAAQSRFLEAVKLIKGALKVLADNPGAEQRRSQKLLERLRELDLQDTQVDVEFRQAYLEVKDYLDSREIVTKADMDARFTRSYF